MKKAVLAISVLLCADAPATATDSVPRAVEIARTTDIPSCTDFVDAAAADGGTGTAEAPHKTIGAAVTAANAGAVVCVAQGTYAEQLKPGEKGFTLAGGFQSGKGFKVRDSAVYVSKAQGSGSGSFLNIVDPGPKDGQLTAIDGFEITGYSQAIVRAFYEPQRFDITNNHIHDNTCADPSLVGAAFTLDNVSGAIRGNVIRKNSCGRGGGGAINDGTNKNSVVIEGNLIDGNSGTEPTSSHGGGLYVGSNTLKITGNLFTNNSVTQWGGGIWIGAYTPGNQFVTATLAWNVYQGNRAGDSGGGFFCDDGAKCIAEHEIYVGNCGGNVLVDGGSGGSGPTTASFNHVTNVGALSPDCSAPGIGFWMDTYEPSAPDAYVISNAVFWGNAEGKDLAATCGGNCGQLKLSIDNSMVQTKAVEDGAKITFGANIVAPADPLFVAPETGDFRLKPGSPASGKGNPDGADLGAYPKLDMAAPASLPALAAASSPAPPPEAPKAAEAPRPEPAPIDDLAPPSQPTAPASPSGPSAAQPAAPPAAADDAKVKAAFDDAKALGTIAAWRAFLANYPTGFHADLAGAYLRNLGYTPGSGAPPPVGAGAPPPAATPELAQPPPAKTPAPQPEIAAPTPPAVVPAPQALKPANLPDAAPTAASLRDQPAVRRGQKFLGFPEKFNRYYTDTTWKPKATLYVSPDGGGDGATRDTPMTLDGAVKAARPGAMVYVLRGAYQGGIEFSKQMSGAYDEPIVLYAERNDDTSIGVTVDCAVGNRLTCFNFEDADYIAVDGFELVGGNYGVRAVGLGFASSQHSRGIAILNSKGRDQTRDPFKTAQSDWTVMERNLGFGAKKGDGHGIYISGGSDWGIVRLNEVHSNESSDLQINADPASNCKDSGIAYDDPRCDAYAGQGEGGQGASDYFLIEGNYCHRSAVGPNFTSVRRSVIRNNIFGPQVRHNVSFWQETDNPKLGSTENRILQNLFITTGRHAVKFENGSGRNIFANNVVLGVTIKGDTVSANPNALLMETDQSSAGIVFQSNLYVSGKFEGRSPDANETARPDFAQGWFESFPVKIGQALRGFTPVAGSPIVDRGKLLPDATRDVNGKPRGAVVDLGPIELP